MNSRKHILVTSGLVLAVSLIAVTIAVWLVSYHYRQASFDLLNAVCGEMAGKEAESRSLIVAALKKYTEGNPDGVIQEDVLSKLGYQVSDFSVIGYRQNLSFAAIGLAVGIILFLFTFLYRNRVEILRIRALADYLEQVNSGNALILSTFGEDEFSKLEDEIYKTVTFLWQTKEQAIQAKNDFAENLSNIAHQIKTPITAMSLAVQKMRLGSDGKEQEQMEKQLNKIVPVIKVRSLGPEAMRSELMLLKLNCDPPSFGQIHQIATLMDAQVVQVTRSSVTLRFAGSPEQCDTLFELTRPFGVKEVARSGVLAVD